MALKTGLFRFGRKNTRIIRPSNQDQDMFVSFCWFLGHLWLANPVLMFEKGLEGSSLTLSKNDVCLFLAKWFLLGPCLKSRGLKPTSARRSG